MIKVQIQKRCVPCHGEAYVYVGKFIDADGQEYPRYLPCTSCDGTGEMVEWIDLKEFHEMLDRAVAMEPDWQELASQEPMTQYKDSCEAAGI